MRRVLLVMLLAACGSKKSTTETKQEKQIAAAQKDLPDGLDMRLSNGKAGPPPFDKSKLAAAKKLGDADVQAILTRAEPLKMETGDQQDFALRPMSNPPPRTGTTIKDTFPAPPSSLLPPAANDAGKDLTVLRYMPEGEVPLAPELTVTFSQPMVPVTSQDDAAKTKPVQLSPEPKGKWRWIGTKTILFDPEVRFPQATTYTVKIPAGTKAENGGTLKKDVSFTFETPPPKMVTHWPGDYGPQHVDVPIFVVFDQKIDPKAVIGKIVVKAPQQVKAAPGQAKDPWGNVASGDVKPVAIKLLDDKEIAKDKNLSAMVEAAKKDEHQGRWLAFKPVQKLPPNAAITVEIPAGTPSAEGPNKTKDAQTFSFRTYPPLRVEKADCGWGGPCTPGMALTFVFNNPLDAEKFSEQQVKVSPAIDNMRVIQNGTNVSVIGMTKARTTYKVTVASSIADQFKQTLGKDDTRTFDVGDAVPNFFGPNGLVVLDPAAGKPTLDYFSTNYDALKVTLYKVQPSDITAYGRYLREMWNKDHPPKMPGTKVFDQLVPTKPTKNELVETQIDLAPALTKAGLGHAIAVVEPHPWPHPYDPPRMHVWVQATKLAVDAHVDHENMIVFATDLATGKPLEGVSLEMKPFGITGTTDGQGLATLALGASERGTHYLLAKKGEDVAFLADDNGYFDEYGSWYKQPRDKTIGWFVFDDRKLYKPGEEVSLKGWLRTIDYGKWGDVSGIAGRISTITYRVNDRTGNEIAKGTMAVSPVGGFDTKFTLPKTPNLGYAYVYMEARGAMRSSYSHSFQIEEFRRPEFEVSAQASPGPFVIGGGGDITVDAKYFAGGALPGAPVNWFLTANQTTYTPPNRDEYVFGSWSPWWGYRGWYEDMYAYPGGGDYKPPPTWNFSGTTDALGEHTLHMDYISAKPAMPFSVNANVSVSDVNRQAWNASTSIIVHPSTVYVGVKTKRPFVEKGTPFDIDLIAVDIDGKMQPGAKIEVKTTRLDWEYKNGQYKTKEVDPQTCAAVAKSDAVPCQFKTPKGGTYQLVATVVDSKGRPNTTKLTYWVGGDDNRPPAREVAQEVVQLIPDKKEYAPGNTAELMVQAPFYPAEGIVTWRRSGIVKTERITLTGPTASLKVPIEDRMTPNLYVQVDLVGMAVRANDRGEPDPTLPKRPAYAVGSINLPIPPKQRSLQVAVTPSVPKLGPGESATFTVEVKDAAGKPVADAEAALVVVDESVLALAGYSFSDPIGSFYPQRGPDTRDWYERAYVKLAQPDVTKLAANSGPQGSTGRMGAGGAPGDMTAMPTTAAAPPAEMDMAVADEAEAMPMKKAEMPKAAKPSGRFAERKESSLERARDQGVLGGLDKADGKLINDPMLAEPTTPVTIRTNFNPLANFSPSVKTDANGKASVQVKMPDNLTRYRVVAIAVAGEKQFGKGESSITARLPLMVRPSPPRFLNFGDTFKLPVVIQNQTDQMMTVRLAARTTNLKLTDGAGREVSVPPNDRVEVQFPAAADLAGTARLQIVGVSGNASDAANLELPVWTPATTEAFATYGVIDEGAIKQKVALPGKVWPQFGGLEVQTASTNLQALTDAVIYLVHYPFDCAEQRSSRILGIASLRDVLTAFKSKDLPSVSSMESSVDRDIEHLSQMQNSDGGYAFWERGYPSNPYLTVYVTQALLKAKAKRFAIKDFMVQRSKYYLQNIESHYDPLWPEDVKNAISAYALYVRKQMGDLDVVKAKGLLQRVGGPEKLPMEANGWLLGTLAGRADAATERAAIMKHAMNKVSETAGAANFTTGYGDGAYLLLASDRRVDAVMLESLIQEKKDLDLIPKLVTGLMAHKKRGRWLNTQENTFVLMALDLYFKTYEKTTPNFVSRIWLGDDYAGDHAFRGRTTEYYQVGIAMKDVTAHDGKDLTIQKDGAGRLYYRIGMKYAPHDLKQFPADYGFAVERRYEGVDDPKDVTQDKDGVWHIKAGARVRVKLNMVNENRRYHVALVDPMPAGLEAMNPALATTGPLPLTPKADASRGRYWWWYGPWYDHQNMRDERVEAFSLLLWEGNHEYEYIARATTPGNFVVPPPKAEEMYMPETFGRGASDRVIVE